MYELLFKAITDKVEVSEEELERCKKYFIPKKLRRRQYLLQQDDVCKYTAFVEKGALKCYSVDDKGNEHIVQFAIEEWWASDLYSFITGEPSVYNIDAIEDCELLLLTKDANEALLKDVPAMERYFRLLSQNAIVAIQRRMLGTLTLTAEEKYNKLVASYPDIVQRVPQHMIASYLGLTPETISRIRKNNSLKK